MSQDLMNLQRLASALRGNLIQCAADPDEDAVHDVRTGTRRLEATIEGLLRELPRGEANEALRDRAQSVLRLLKKARRAAGPVRDLDVHRGILEKLTKRAVGAREAGEKDSAEEARERAAPVRIGGEPDALESVEAGHRVSGVEQQAAHLDAWLKHQRADLAQTLRDQAQALAAKLDTRMSRLEEAVGSTPLKVVRKPPAVLALDSFAGLATEMQSLDAGNLHDFRKGAKKARYVAELAEETDLFAGKVGKTLKKLQDEIGDWHDWLVLAGEAHTALGEEGAQLTAMIEAECEQHYGAAMKTAAKLRGRLMGEWLAVAQAPRRSGARSGPRARRMTQR